MHSEAAPFLARDILRYRRPRDTKVLSHLRHEHTSIFARDGGVTTQAGEGKVDNAKGDSAKCKRSGETGHKPVRCPDQFFGVCGGKGHLVEICANVVTVLACEDAKDCNEENDAAVSGEEK